MRIAAMALLSCAQALGLPVGSASAGVPTLAECAEAAEFIANAAHARDNGVSRAGFLDRMEGDFVAIRGLPPGLRWFVKDQDDERMLLDAAARVFDRPQPAERHRAEFFAVCLEGITAQVPRNTPAGAPGPPS